MDKIEIKSTNSTKECKNCQLCNIYENICLVDKKQCYEKGVQVHDECDCFVEGHWRPHGFDSDKRGFPPVGLIPKKVHDNHRVDEIFNAMKRFSKAEYPIPIEWIDELIELLTK